VKERKDIDRLIREKLAQWQPPYEATHWEKLLQRLSEEPDFGFQDPDALEEAAFALGTSAFEGQGDASLENSWLELERRLYDEGFWAYEPEMETLLRHRLRYREEPYNPTHWWQMSRRIDEEFSVFYRLLRSKVLEFVAMVLLLVFVWQYMPFMPSGKWSSLAWRPSTEGQPGQRRVRQEDSQPLEALSFRPEAVESEQEVWAFQEGKQPVEDREKDGLPPLAVAPRPQMDVRMEEEVSQKLSNKSKVLSEQSKSDKFALLPKLFVRKKHELAILKKERKLPAKFLNPFASRGRVALWAAYDYNVVYSASDPILETPSYKTRSSGVSAGIQLGVGKKHWEFGFGAIYSSLAYRSFTPRLQYGSFELLVEEEFDGLQFDLLQLPVHFSLYLQPEHPKWDFYASVGVSGTFVLTSDYDRHYRYYASDKPDPQELAAVLSQSKFKQKTFSEGLFEGGSLKENSYLFGELGVGVEYRLSRRWQFFAEPTYRVHLNNRQLGPNRDYLRNLSLRLGLKATVW